jgi:hypothetical protein
MGRHLLAAFLAVGTPLGALADRGALSVDAGGVIAGVHVAPAVGSGDPVTGSVAGATVGARYALSNRLEITASVDWFAEAPFYNDNVVVTTSNGVFAGQLQSRLSAYSAKVGAHYVTGLVWRFRAGAQVGWLHRSFTRMDLIDVSRPGAPRSFGLALGSRDFDDMVVSPMVGVEWLISDRISLAVTPRADIVLGSPSTVWVSVPLIMSYSWYGLFR